jgi:hypothetical protein
MPDVHVALCARLDAKPGKEKEVAPRHRENRRIGRKAAGVDVAK